MVVGGVYPGVVTLPEKAPAHLCGPSCAQFGSLREGGNDGSDRSRRGVVLFSSHYSGHPR